MKKLFPRIKRKFKYDIVPVVSIYFSFPHIRAFMVVLIMCVVTFIAAYLIEDSFWASIFANIFAGLITGIVLFLLTGIKQIYIARQELKCEWLKKLHDQIMKYEEMKRKMMSRDLAINTAEFEECIYDTICEAHNVNVSIQCGERDKKLGFNAVRYCKKQYDYDVELMSDRDDRIREKIILGEYSTKREADELFREISHDLFSLNHKIITEINDIEIKIKVSGRSII